MEVEAVLGRARSAVGRGIRYGIGKGGMNPGLPTPGPKELCDCSGFVAWCLGMSRKTSERFYVTDIGRSVGIFESIKQMLPGAVIVYPDKDQGSQQGHIGIVLDAKHVIHCSKGNDKNSRDAIQITPPTVFSKREARLGWLVGLH